MEETRQRVLGRALLVTWHTAQNEPGCPAHQCRLESLGHRSEHLTKLSRNSQRALNLRLLAAILVQPTAAELCRLSVTHHGECPDAQFEYGNDDSGLGTKCYE